MALIIPTAFSTYETFADSTSTEGGKLRKYVLAQFRSNANLDWVGVLRARLVKDELKYRDFREVRPRLKKDRELWKKIEMGVGQASVIVIDPEQVYYAVESILESEGAEKDIDFDEKSLIDECATAIIGMTPIAYLPFELTKAVPWSWFDAIQNLEDYLPNKLKKRIGGNLRDAKIFAARAHATFDLYEINNSITRTTDIISSPLGRILLAELTSTFRSFDSEHEKSIKVLNKAIEMISSKLELVHPLWQRPEDVPLIREVDSRAIDEIQAADIAAGWAREIIDTASSKALGVRFERVWLNGRRVK